MIRLNIVAYLDPGSNVQMFKKQAWHRISGSFFLSLSFEQNKLSFDDFLMTTWEREKEREMKKEPQILCLCRKFRINIQDDEGLNYHQEAAFGANTTPGTKEVHESHELFNECLYTLWPLDRIEIRELMYIRHLWKLLGGFRDVFTHGLVQLELCPEVATPRMNQEFHERIIGW